MKYLRALRYLGYLWMLPNILVSCVFLMTCFVLGWVDYVQPSYPGILVSVRGPMARSLSKRWYAHTIGIFMFFYRSADADDETFDFMHLRHEQRHVDQQKILGPLQPVLYAILMLYGLVRYHSFFRAYTNCWFERDARKSAGQE